MSGGNGKYHASCTVSANAGVQGTQVQCVTNDESKRRRVTGVQCSDHTAGGQLQMVLNSKALSVIDDSIFTALSGFAPVDVTYDLGDGIFFAINNLSGSNITNARVTIEYEVG